MPGLERKAGVQGKTVSKPHGVPRKASPESTLNMERSVAIVSRSTRPNWAVALELTSSEAFAIFELFFKYAESIPNELLCLRETCLSRTEAG